jgi:signal transduction histidine kinase
VSNTTNPASSTASGYSLYRVITVHEAVFLLLVLIAGGLGGVGAYYGHQYAQHSAVLTERLSLGFAVAANTQHAIKSLTHAVAMQDPGVARRADELLVIIMRDIKALQTGSSDEQEQAAVRELANLFARLDGDLRAMVAGEPLKRESARIKLLGRAYEESVIKAFNQRLYAAIDRMDRQREALALVLEQRLQLAPFVIGLTLLVATGLVWFTRAYLRQRLLQPLQQLTADADAMRRGDLERKPDVGGVDEVQRLGDALHSLATSLSDVQRKLVARERDAALGTLVPVVAHNIRNPLASIRAAAQLMDQHASAEDLEDSRMGIIETVDRLERWVASLLTYLKPIEPQMAAVKFSVLIDDVMQLAAHKAEVHGVTLSLADAARDITVIADAALIEQAIYGVLMNAIEASPRNSQVELALHVEDAHLVLRVRDHGTGISFDPDPRALVPGPSTKRMGTGLGIPFAFKTIQAHEWEIHYASPTDGGVEVTVRAPVAV